MTLVPIGKLPLGASLANSRLGQRTTSSPTSSQLEDRLSAPTADYRRVESSPTSPPIVDQIDCWSSPTRLQIFLYCRRTRKNQVFTTVEYEPASLPLLSTTRKNLVFINSRPRRYTFACSQDGWIQVSSAVVYLT